MGVSGVAANPFTWVAVDARTGVLIADLPDLSVPTIKRTICRYESATATLPLPTAPENWVEATRPKAVNFILLSDDDPVWGGMVSTRQRGSGDLVEMSLATLESYLDSRYVGDVTYTGIGQNDIIASLVGAYIADGAKPGLPIRVQYATAGAGTPRDRTCTDASDKTVYSVLQELAGIAGGPEWTIEWEWQHNPERLTPVLYVGDRIGIAATPGFNPAASFEMPGCVQAAALLEDYTSGKGANDVMAVSTATGDVRPESAHHVLIDDGRPTIEYRFTPSTSITQTSTLDDHASAALAVMAPGSIALALTADYLTAPPLGTDWRLGDDVAFTLGGLVPDGSTHTESGLWSDLWTDTFGVTGPVLDYPNGRDTVPAFPGGFSGVARCIGWELTLGDTPLVTPILESTGV